MSLFIANAYADADVPPAGPSAWGQLIMLGVFAVVFYFLLLRPQMKRQKEHKTLMEALQKGDEVITAGGVVGRISKVAEGFVTLEVAENVVIHVQRPSVQAVLPKGTIKGLE